VDLRQYHKQETNPQPTNQERINKKPAEGRTTSVKKEAWGPQHVRQIEVRGPQHAMNIYQRDHIETRAQRNTVSISRGRKEKEEREDNNLTWKKETEEVRIADLEERSGGSWNRTPGRTKWGE
jgi:hypothetical protein